MQRKTIHAIYSGKETYANANITGELRSEPIGKVKIFHHLNKSKVCTTDDREQIMIDNCKVRMGSGTKLDKLQNPLKICIHFF